MGEAPQSPLLPMAIAFILAIISYGCHRVLNKLRNNELLPLDAKMKGRKNARALTLKRTWPFRDEYQQRVAERSLWHANLVIFKWVLAFAAVLAGVVYPIIYVIRLGVETLAMNVR